MQNITLNNGIAIPQVGLGVFRTKDGEETINAVKWALEAGYRHIDTAAVYRNETGTGIGIQESGVKREDIFLTTKLWNDDVRAGRVREAFEESLKKLQTDYVDLYLIHWPADGFEKAWKEMESLYNEGLIKAIGLSNFHKHHLEKIDAIANVEPAVDQIESNLYFNNQELINYLQGRKIVVEAWSPLGGTGGHIVDDPVLAEVAKKHGKSPVQIIIRWHMQRGIVVLPKSTHKERIIDNFKVDDFELTSEEMELLNGLNKNQRTGSDPDNFNF